MAIASTGRLSSTDPNLQNIPIRTEEGSRIRHAFIAEPGHVLVSADYSQIELRLLAHVADIPALRESFARGEDIHARTASEVFGVPMEGMDPMTRRRAKAINFGIIYGISGFGLARQLGIAPGEARLFIDRYFERYPGIRAYMERTKEGGADQRLRDHAVRPALLGAGHRRQELRAPRLRRAAGDQRAVAGRCRRHHQARHGAAARALAAAGLARRMLLQVHDELLFEAPSQAVRLGLGRPAGDGECRDAVGAAGGGNRAGPNLGRRALNASRRINDLRRPITLREQQRAQIGVIHPPRAAAATIGLARNATPAPPATPACPGRWRRLPPPVSPTSAARAPRPDR